MRVRNNEACAVSRSNSRIHRFDAALLRQGNLKASVVSEKPNKYARRHEYGLSHFDASKWHGEMLRTTACGGDRNEAR